MSYTTYEQPMPMTRVIMRSDKPGYCVIKVMEGLYIPCRGDGSGTVEPYTLAADNYAPAPIVRLSSLERAWDYLDYGPAVLAIAVDATELRKWRESHPIMGLTRAVDLPDE